MYCGDKNIDMDMDKKDQDGLHTVLGEIWVRLTLKPVTFPERTFSTPLKVGFS